MDSTNNLTAGDDQVNDTNKRILEKLECPFTWNMEDIVKYRKEYSIKRDKYGDQKNDDRKNDDQKNDGKNLYPIINLMHNIIFIYDKTCSSSDIEQVLNKLQECNKFIHEIEEIPDSQISLEVANYILQSTQYFVYQKHGMIHEVEKILTKIREKEVEFLNKKNNSTLLACKSICWGKYRIGQYKAEELIRSAIEANPKCHLWYLILAITLQRQRKNVNSSPTPSTEEIESFSKAHKLSQNNPLCETYIAQINREMKNYKEARKIYEKIFNNLPENRRIVLKLAIGFIRLKDFEKAKICLEKAGPKKPSSTTYLHYQGIFYKEKKLFKEALPYYKKTINRFNLSAEKDYILCQLKINSNFDVTSYLESVLDKYQALPENQLQTFILDLAFCYWKKKKDFTKALDYFLRAMKINPEARWLINYFDYIDFNFKEDRNVFHVLKNYFLPEIDQFSAKDTKIKKDKLKDIINNYANNTIQNWRLRD